MDFIQITPLKIAQLVAMQPASRHLCDWHRVDYSRGMRRDGLSASLWTLDGKRIDVTAFPEGGGMITQTREKDPVLPPARYEDTYNKIADKIAESASLKPCIKPECDVVVDRRKRKSGACCKDHMNYECTHPDCVKRAEENGWKRATHSYATKVGKAHLEFRKER